MAISFENCADSFSLSIVIPAKNEAFGLSSLLPDLISLNIADEIIVVDDGSSDSTSEVCKMNGVTLVRHPRSLGNGAAVKTGIRNASGDYVALMDADGQHRAQDLASMIKRFSDGYDMVVGARNWEGQAGVHRGLMNLIFNYLASWMVGQAVPDLTSGFRIAKRRLLLRFVYLMPNGFSYPTTTTMSFFRAGYSVAYEPVKVLERVGKSHIRPLKDGFRFLLIIFRIGVLYSPLKLFLPISLAFFSAGFLYYAYTYYSFHRFTNMSALLLSTSILVFLMGLVSEQITMLNYRDSEKD
ncbi:glycosyltransferase family 2 protein [Dechloromonas hortensis]|uniref:glycosyltransferase family 2 protein n=1 Tax=Dechloromonas hortensis TaxID=337779 RepID=UPI001FE4915E|nr:glycosyltransferase family 2 protein [Dechloromonas hortensis]